LLLAPLPAGPRFAWAADIQVASSPSKTTTVPITGASKGEDAGKLTLSLMYLMLPPPPGAAASSGAAAPASAASSGKNTLRLRVFGARGLSRKGKMYLKIESASGVECTKPGKESTKEPEFDACYLVPAPSGEATVTLSVFSQNLIRDGFMGALSLHAKDFDRGTPRKEWYSLGNRDGVEGGGSRGEVEIMVAWESQPIALTNITEFMSSTGAIKEGAPTADGQQGEVLPPEKRAESEEALAARQEEERRKKALLEGMELKRGDYKVLVHVHEVRQLKDEDLNASVDPVVKVNVMGQQQQTKTAWMTNSVVFDHLMLFSFKDLEAEQLERGSITVSVYDVDHFSRDDLVGLYTVDIPNVYFREHHEMHMQWLGITDPTNRRKRGLMGYVKVSIAVLGPDDKRHIWDDAEEMKLLAAEREHGLESVVLMPPTIERTVKFLVITAHRAENLMRMDKGNAFRPGGIDAYLQVDFAGNPPARTPWVACKGPPTQPLNVTWNLNNQLWIPVMIPTMTTGVRCSVNDYDFATSDELVGAFYLNFRQLRLQPFYKRWINLYGAAEDMHGTQADSMAEFPNSASHYRGRILLSAEVVEHPESSVPEHVHARSSQLPALGYMQTGIRAEGAEPEAGSSEPTTPPPIPPDFGVDEPNTTEYTLRALIVGGSDIPAKFNILSQLGVTRSAKMSIQVAIGSQVLSTEHAMVDKGNCSWNKQLSTTLRLPKDPTQVPDVFLYLVRSETGQRVCYARWSGAELLADENPFDAAWNPCEWVPLQEDYALNVIADQQQPGVVLCRMALGRSSLETSDPTWTDDLVTAARKGRFELRVHLYQGRNIPAADSNGTSDPYVRVHVAGAMKQSLVKERTTSPQFYETLVFPDLDLPTSPEFQPPVTLQVWDKDIRFDDFISELRIPLGDERVIRSTVSPDGSHDIPATLPDPLWFPLTALGREKEGPQGEILVSFQVIEYVGVAPGSDPPRRAPRPSSIVPETDDWIVEVLTLGARSLSATLGLPTSSPRLDIDLGDRSRLDAVKSTKHSNFPSGSDPNFCQRLLLPCQLPRREIFAPSVNIAVVDRRLGGLLQPLVGTATVSLVDKIPGTRSFRPPTGGEQTSNLHMQQMSDSERSNPPIFPKKDRESALFPKRRGPARVMGRLGKGEHSEMDIVVDGEETSSPRRKRKPKMQVPTSYGADASSVLAAAAEQDAKAEALSGGGLVSVSRSRSLSASNRMHQSSKEGAGTEDIVIDGIEVGGLDLPMAFASPLLSIGGAEPALAKAEISHAKGSAVASVSAAAAAASVPRGASTLPNVIRSNSGGIAAAPAEPPMDLSFLTNNLKFVDGAIASDGTPRFHPEDKAAKYMRHRRVYHSGLEEALKTAPFDTVAIMRGQDVGRGKVLGWTLPPNRRRVGVVKCLIRVIKDAKAEPPAGWSKILEPKEYEVRAYVLKGLGLQPMDADNRSDPYLVGKLGKETVSFRKDFIPKTLNPDFYKVMSFRTTLPGPSLLEISAWDYDSVTFDDLIGKTVIDLEDRWFDPRWQALGAGFETQARLAPKPLEERRIFSPGTWQDTGVLQVWVDILDPAKSRDYPEVDIEPPPPQPFQCRVIIWRTWGVPAHDVFTDQNDLYVRCWLEGKPAQSTDVHRWCKTGCGSFNWRMIFETEVPCKDPILHVQMWDQDYLKPNELIGQAELALGKHFDAARHYRGRYRVMDEIRGAFEGLTGAHYASLDGGGIESDGEDDDDQAPLLKQTKKDGDDRHKSGGARSVSVPALSSAVAAAELQAAPKPAPAGKAAHKSPEAMEKALAGALEKREKAEQAALKEFGPPEEENSSWAPLVGAAIPAAKSGDNKAVEDDRTQRQAAQETVSVVREKLGVPKHPQAENAAWLPIYQMYGKDDEGNKVMLRSPEYVGKVLLSVELLPMDVAEAVPAGLGRSDPNINPTLPPPAGRVHFSLNPFYLGYECLGPRMFGNCLLCCCLVLLLLAAVFLSPFISAVAGFVQALGDVVGTIVAVLLSLLVAGPLLYVCFRYIWFPRGIPVLADIAADNHKYLDLLQVQQSHEAAAKYGFERSTADIGEIEEKPADPLEALDSSSAAKTKTPTTAATNNPLRVAGAAK
jgi:hypothetical protein